MFWHSFFTLLPRPNGHGNHGKHGPPHPSVNLGSPPPPTWVANTEDENQPEVGGGKPQIRVWGGVSVLSVANRGWRGWAQVHLFNRIPENAEKNLFLTESG